MRLSDSRPPTIGYAWPVEMQPEQYELLYQCEPGMWWFAGMRRITSTFLDGFSRPGLRCLEAGCGTGFNSMFFQQRYGWRVFPADLSPHALAHSGRRGAERLTQANIADLPYMHEAFDCVTSFDVLYSLPCPARASALAEFYRVTKPGGFVLVRVPALHWMSGGHSRAVSEVQRFDLGEVCAELQSAGFQVRRATYANALLLPLAAVKRKILEPLGLARDDGDVRMPPAIVNRVFLGAMVIEDAMLRIFGRLPIGLSAIVLAIKRVE